MDVITVNAICGLIRHRLAVTAQLDKIHDAGVFREEVKRIGIDHQTAWDESTPGMCAAIADGRTHQPDWDALVTVAHVLIAAETTEPE